MKYDLKALNAWISEIEEEISKSDCLKPLIILFCLDDYRCNYKIISAITIHAKLGHYGFQQCNLHSPMGLSEKGPSCNHDEARHWGWHSCAE